MKEEDHGSKDYSAESPQAKLYSSTLQHSSIITTMNELAVPDEHGLLIHLHNNNSGGNNELAVVDCSSEADAHYPGIHPHCHAPRCLEDVYLLYGGGSGTAVFHG